MRSVGSGGRRRGRRDEDEDEVQMEDGKSLMPRTVIRLRERRKEGLRSKGRRQERRVSGSRNKKRKGKKTGARLRYPEFLQSQEKIGAKRAERFGTRGRDRRSNTWARARMAENSIRWKIVPHSLSPALSCVCCRGGRGRKWPSL